jgi:DNA helicase TIP49 (TBP-interacting protein)
VRTKISELTLKDAMTKITSYIFSEKSNDGNLLIKISNNDLIKEFDIKEKSLNQLVTSHISTMDVREISDDNGKILLMI